MFSEDNLNKIEKLKSQYPTTKAITLPVLWLAQEQFGWISHETMMYIAELLDVPVSEIYGVVTFYTMYNQEPRGKYHLQVCTNVSCSLRGSEQIVRTICESQKIKMGETSADKRFTITEVECLGSCGTAPMMQVNNDYYENLSVEKVKAMLEEMR